MGTLLEDTNIEGDVSCNNLTVRGGLNVAGIPMTMGFNAQQGGVPIPNNPHQTLNVTGGATIVDAGAGVATLTGGVIVQDEGIPIPFTPQSTLNFVGNGVTATDAPGSIATVAVSRNAALFFGAIDIGAAADSQFLRPGFGATSSPTDDFQMPIPFVGASSVRCLFVRHNLANGNGENVVYTVFVNGVATALTVTLRAGVVGQVSDMVNSVAVVQGDRVSVQATKPLAIGAGTMSVTVSLVID